MNLELHSKLQKSRIEEFTKFIEENSWTRGIFTLDNIYKYASDEELSAIVHSILNRSWATIIDKNDGNCQDCDFCFCCHNHEECILPKQSDKDMSEIVKGLRTPQ